MKPEMSKQRLTPIWHSTPTAVIGGGVGWAGGQLEAQEKRGVKQRRKEHLTARKGRRGAGSQAIGH